MNKNGLVTEMAKRSGLTKKDAEQALNAITTTVQTTIRRKEKVTLVGFGTWENRQRAARKGMNPKTGQPLRIPTRRVPVFKAGKELKNIVK